jgi:hypothetical protein
MSLNNTRCPNSNAINEAVTGTGLLRNHKQSCCSMITNDYQWLMRSQGNPTSRLHDWHMGCLDQVFLTIKRVRPRA